MPGVAFYILFAVILAAVVFVLWRYWADLVDRTPEEEAYERRLTSLNERQANRYSDDELTSGHTGDDAWRIMVDRGQRAARRDRYGGDLSRRRRDRATGRKKR